MARAKLAWWWWGLPGLLLILMWFTNFASADPHPHEPDQPAAPPGDIIIGDVTGEGGIGGQGGNANNVIDIDDEKQAPGLGLSTASDSVGVGITTPVFGFLVNMPWTWGDRKTLAICDRIVGTPAWPDCMCRTSVMKKIHADAETCASSLGGGSDPGGKTDGPQGLNRGETLLGATSGLEDLMLAQVEAEEMERYHDDLKGEIAAGKEIAQAQQTEIEYLKEERAATEIRQQDLERNQQVQQQQYDDFFGRFKRAGEVRRAAKKGDPDG